MEHEKITIEHVDLEADEREYWREWRKRDCRRAAVCFSIVLFLAAMVLLLPGWVYKIAYGQSSIPVLPDQSSVTFDLSTATGILKWAVARGYVPAQMFAEAYCREWGKERGADPDESHLAGLGVRNGDSKIRVFCFHNGPRTLEEGEEACSLLNMRLQAVEGSTITCDTKDEV